MIGWQSKLIFSLLLLLTIVNFAARVVGSTRPPNAVFSGCDEQCAGKPRPCWHGIVLGVTPVDEASSILRHIDQIVLVNPSSYDSYYQPGCNIQLRTQPDSIGALVIMGCEVTLGDAMAAWGEPVSLKIACGTEVRFRDVTVTLDRGVSRITANSHLRTIALLAQFENSSTALPENLSQPWAGFMSVPRYELRTTGIFACPCCRI
ncbi:MAG: hypothetical protein R3E39_20525 [Anaerolineae bacterium]